MSDKPRAIELLYSLVFAVTITLVCRNDARNLGQPLLPIIQFVMLLTWPIAVPWYLIWARGVHGVLLALGWSAVFVVLYSSAAITVWIIRTQ